MKSGGGEPSGGKAQGGRARVPDKNWLEWTVFGVSAVLLLALAVYLVRESRAGHDRPPDVVVTLGTALRGAGGYIVPVEARNDGDLVAEDLTIVVRLTMEGREDERAELNIDYLPRGSSHSGYVTFRADPRRGHLEASTAGYSVP